MTAPLDVAQKSTPRADRHTYCPTARQAHRRQRRATSGGDRLHAGTDIYAP